MMDNLPENRGLTKVEMLVCVGIVLLVVSLLMPFGLRQQVDARRLFCEQRITKLAIVAQKYDDQHGELPGYRNFQAVDATGAERGTGWVFPLLPWFEVPGDSSGGRVLSIHLAYGPEGADLSRGQAPNERIPELLCPAFYAGNKRPGDRPLSYVANCGQPDVEDAEGGLPPDWAASGLFFNHLLPKERKVSVSLDWLAKHDGQEYTLLFSENMQAGDWTSDREPEVGFLWVVNLLAGEPSPQPLIHGINEEPDGAIDGKLVNARPSSLHPGGVNVAMADGSTQFVNDKIDYLAYVRMMTSAGQELKPAGEDKLLGKPWRD